MVRIPYGEGYWQFPIDPQRLRSILGQDDPERVLPSLSDAEVSAVETAYDIMVDPHADEDMRKDMWLLRGVPYPLRSDRAQKTMRLLMDPPATSGGIAGSLNR